MRARSLAAVIITFAIAACSDTRSPTGLIRPVAEIIDGSDPGLGNADFFWLPPIVLGPSASVLPNVEGLTPEVKIFHCTATSGDPCTSLDPSFVADFTTSTGTASEVVRDGGGLYIVNWHTNGSASGSGVNVPDGTYRICVSLSDVGTLGHADVFVGDNGKAVKNARSNDDVPLVDGSTLPIKFRIEDGYKTGGSDVGCGGGGPLMISGTVTLCLVPPNSPPNTQCETKADEGREVQLLTGDGTATLLDHQFADASGKYSFSTGLQNGHSYLVCEVAPVFGPPDFVVEATPTYGPTCPDGSVGYAITLTGSSTGNDFANVSLL